MPMAPPPPAGPAAPRPEASAARPPPRLTSPRGPARRRRGQAPSAAEPWLADHPWRRDAAEDLTGNEARKALLVGGILTLVASIIAAAVLPEVDGLEALGAAVIPALLLAGGLWLLSRGVRTVLRRGRHGVSELRFARFPFFLGETLDATLVRQGATAPLDGLHARLTCLREVKEEGSGMSDDIHRDDSYKRAAAWCETRAVRGLVGERVALRFDLPPEGPEVAGTALLGDPPTYWELEAWTSPAEGPAYHAVFLVPVYQRPGDGG